MSESAPTLKFASSKSDNPVWSHFEKCTTQEKARCKKCGSLLSVKGGSTGAMRGHLKAKHEIDVELKNKPATGASSDASASGDKESFV